MTFIYHLVPDKMIGEVLVPLAGLKELDPSLYADEIKKYSDHPHRKMLPQRILKKINCSQSEVLHFSPLHPRLMFEGLRSIFPAWNQPSRFFEIPIERIRGLPAVVFDMNRTGSYVFGDDEPEELFELVNDNSYRMLTSLPPEALEFYQQWKLRGERSAPAMGRIPHLMVMGPVSVKDCAIIDWRD